MPERIGPCGCAFDGEWAHVGQCMRTIGSPRDTLVQHVAQAVAAILTAPGAQVRFEPVRDEQDTHQGYISAEDAVMLQIAAIRSKQRRHWSYEHDQQRESWQWLGLITQYAAAGRYQDAAALCVAAALVEREARW